MTPDMESTALKQDGSDGSSSDRHEANGLGRLPSSFSIRLASMLAGDPQEGADGLPYPIDTTTKISLEQGLWLYDFCLRHEARHTLEVGLAYGYSALFITAAHHSRGNGSHVAIDPFQRTLWHGIGTRSVERALGSAPIRFDLIPERSDCAAVDLARAKRNFDLIFLDGNHRFDDILLDITLYSRLCAMQGHLVIDDMRLPSVAKAVAFLRTNRADFTEVPTPLPNASIFRKTQWDRRRWDHFSPF